MIEVKFRINGREVSPATAEDPVTAAQLTDMSAMVQRRVGRAWCSEHHRAPWVLASGPSASKLKVSVQGCCREVVNKAKEALAQTAG